MSEAATFLRIWRDGWVHPGRAFTALKPLPAPAWGARAMVIRWLGTAVTTGLLSWLLGRRPIAPSYLTFMPPVTDRPAWILLSLAFGAGIWLLMSATAHVIFRLAGRPCDFDRVLNIVGLGMLIPMPAVWAWDWAMLGLDAFNAPVMGVSHALFQAWETGLEAVGFRRVLGVGSLPAVAVAIGINMLFILLAMIFVR
jgi:hypothetical protein